MAERRQQWKQLVVDSSKHAKRAANNRIKYVSENQLSLQLELLPAEDCDFANPDGILNSVKTVIDKLQDLQRIQRQSERAITMAAFTAVRDKLENCQPCAGAQKQQPAAGTDTNTDAQLLDLSPIVAGGRLVLGESAYTAQDEVQSPSPSADSLTARLSAEADQETAREAKQLVAAFRKIESSRYRFPTHEALLKLRDVPKQTWGSIKEGLRVLREDNGNKDLGTAEWTDSGMERLWGFFRAEFQSCGKSELIRAEFWPEVAEHLRREGHGEHSALSCRFVILCLRITPAVVLSRERRTNQKKRYRERSHYRGCLKLAKHLQDSAEQAGQKEKAKALADRAEELSKKLVSLGVSAEDTPASTRDGDDSEILSISDSA
jgi:hypothetical protein